MDLTKSWWSEEDTRAKVLADSAEVRDQDVRTLKELRKMLVGPEYGGETVLSDDSKSPTNSTYGFYARMHGDCLGGDLKPIAKAPVGTPEESVALSIEGMAEEAYKRGGGPEVMELVYGDMVCGYGGAVVTPSSSSNLKLSEDARGALRQPLGVQPWKASDQPHDGALTTEQRPQVDADPRLPQVHYLAPGTWGYDRRAFTQEHAEFFWYETIHDVPDLLERAERPGSGWNRDKIVEAAQSRDFDRDSEKVGGSKVRDKGELEGLRDKLVVTTLVVKTAKIPGEECPDHHNGVVYTMWAPPGRMEIGYDIKKPEWNFAPPFGQFVCFKQHSIGEDSIPFSVLTANMEKMRAADAMHAVAYRKIKDHKKAYAADARLKKHIEMLEETKDGDIVLVPGLGEFGGLVEFERGGLDQHTVAGIQYMDAQLAQDLGLDPASRGAAQGNGTTATETTLAAQQAQGYANQFSQAFNRSAARMFKILGWYAAYDKRFVVPASLPERARFHEQQMKMVDPEIPDPDRKRAAYRAAKASGAEEGVRLWEQGGAFTMDPFADYDGIRWEVNEVAQRRKSVDGRRVDFQMLMQDLTNTLMMARQLPEFDFTMQMRTIEENYGVRGLVEAYDSEMASQIAQVQIETGNAPEARVEGTGASDGQQGFRVTMAQNSSNRQSRLGGGQQGLGAALQQPSQGGQSFGGQGGGMMPPGGMR